MIGDEGPYCQGERRVIAVITKPDAIRRILGHLGLPADRPEVSANRHRAPPEPLFVPDPDVSP